MKKLFSVAALTAILISGNSFTANAQRMCGNELIQAGVQNDPQLKNFFEEYFEKYDAENKELANTRALRKGTANTYERVIIPVVFHVVLNQQQIDQIGGTNGIVDRINSQLEALNEDFSATNTDLSGVPAEFKEDIGNANIHFELAKIAPDGKAQAGIVYELQSNSFDGFSPLAHGMKLAGSGSAPWDVTKYINIWITLLKPNQSGGQVLGFGYNGKYSYNRYQTTAYAGIVMHYTTLGRKTATNQVFYNNNTTLGRTLTHEMGHFFNIWHIWGKDVQAGDKSCVKDDGIDDTPLQEAANTSCPTVFPKSNCTQQPHVGGEMYMNYMDYSSDICTKMFTVGQVERMRKELEPGGEVSLLANSQHLAFWPAGVSAVEYNNTIDIAPNPSNGRVSINLIEKYNDLKQITVMNTLGQSVKMIPVTDQAKTRYKLDLSNMTDGIYIVQLHFDEGIVSKKVVLQ